MKKITILLLCSICLFAQNQPRNQNVVAGEYFINQDPGEGRGTSLSSSAYGFGSVTINQTFSLSNKDALYIRFKSSNGKWSAPRSFKYRQPLPASGSQIQAGEYFINNDPGYGKATGFSIGYDGKILITSLVVNKGDNIFIRSKDSFGRWGEAVCAQYHYKVLIGAQFQVKYKGGTQSAWLPMTTPSQQSASAFYTSIGTLVGVNRNTVESVSVKFQSEDDVWGTILTDLKEKTETTLPQEFSLSNAYPNPFNPTTKIKFDIPKQSHVKLIVYDILSREIEKLVDNEMLPGSYEVMLHGKDLPSGVYFYQLRAGDFVETRKLVLVK
ncbi:MAG: beta-glucuronidase [Stygiobacter sp.]|nr:MAG: beta-glucuronidase [Stygiobacter sp.]KAF0212786.1 MAG: hypothetical protein FD178_3105 [Ignavibacteria bacterium]